MTAYLLNLDPLGIKQCSS